MFSKWLNYFTDTESEVDVNLLVNGLKYPNLKNYASPALFEMT
jgi:hypothetical protein